MRRGLWGCFVSRFEDALARYRRRGLAAEEAGELLGMSGRHFRRLCHRYEEAGEEGLADHRMGRPSPRRADAGEVARMQVLFRERYSDFTVKHFHEEMQRHHGYTLGYTVTRLSLQSAGLVAKAERRGRHRKKRPRRPQAGMLLFQDASTHAWLSGLDRTFDLVVTMDDATSAMTSMFLTEEEGTLSSLRGLHETIERHGLFGALYTDRGSHYFLTPKAGGAVDKRQPTQVGRALAQLGIRHIPSYAPEARGRIERAFGTLQQRLPPDLRLAGISTLEAANTYLRETYLPAHNARFAVAAEDPAGAWVAYRGGPLADILCVQVERQVGRDNCVNWRGVSLQIPPQRHRHHYVKATVRVHEYPDGTLALFDGPRCLARYDSQGRATDDEGARDARAA